MRIIDIANNIDKSEANNTGYIDFDTISSELGVPFSFYDEPEDNRLQAYWIESLYESGSIYGKRMYFFDDEPVALSTKDGRKSSEYFYWFSEEAVSKVKNYFLSFIAKEKPHVTICDVNEDIGDSYKVYCLSEVMDWSIAKYKGHPIELVEIIRDKEDYYGSNAQLKINIPKTGKEHVVELKDIDFLFHLTNLQKKPSLDNQIQVASIQASEAESISSKKNKDFER